MRMKDKDKTEFLRYRNSPRSTAALVAQADPSSNTSQQRIHSLTPCKQPCLEAVETVDLTDSVLLK